MKHDRAELTQETIRRVCNSHLQTTRRILWEERCAFIGLVTKEVLWLGCQISSTGWCVGTLSAQLVALLGKAVASLKGRVPLEEMGYCGGGWGQNMRIYSPTPFPICLVFFFFFLLLSIKMSTVPNTKSYFHEVNHVFPSTLDFLHSHKRKQRQIISQVAFSQHMVTITMRYISGW